MIAVDRREDGSSLSRFREDDGTVHVTHVQRHIKGGVTQSLTVTSERTAGRIVSLPEGWSAHVWTMKDYGGLKAHTFTKLGVFSSRQQAVEAIATAFDWCVAEARMARLG